MARPRALQKAQGPAAATASPRPDAEASLRQISPAALLSVSVHVYGYVVKGLVRLHLKDWATLMEDNIKHFILFGFGDTPERPTPPAPLPQREPPPRCGPGSGAPPFMDPRRDPRRRRF